jgi:hypothetical protein
MSEIEDIKSSMIEEQPPASTEQVKGKLDWSLKELMKLIDMPYSKEILEENQYS